MSNTSDRDYVLGTGDEEIARLGLQHSVWRERVLECWRRAGIGAGSRVVDFGAGPGFATLDLAELVGANGEVIALERSARFAAHARAQLAARGIAHARVHELDLMTDALPASGMDAAWCRWVASFVSSPKVLVEKIAGTLKAGGVAIFHEYAHYETWRMAPHGAAHAQFVQQVMASWRASGGEPDIALQLPALLLAAGFSIERAEPRMFVARPGEPGWRWPASFIDINLRRLEELGRTDAAFSARVRAELAAAEADPATLLYTPLVLELVARKT